ncbi:MAG: polysaccharide biosynthesis protein [Clostridia bacterium]|nr:polysaccharide biosynthesis protein [Clostridia bacterium]
MPKSRTVNSVRNIIWACIQKIVMIVFPFIVRSVMIMKLGEEYTGLSSLFTSILSILSLAELGFGFAMVYCMYEPINKGDNQQICALLNLYKKIYSLIGAVILGVGLCLLPFLEHFIKGAVPNGINIYTLYLIYLSNTVVSYFMFAYKSSLMTAYQRSDIISQIMTVTNILLYALQIGVMVVFESFYLYAVLIPATTLLMNISYEIISRKLYPEITPRGTVSKDVKDKIKKRVIGIMLYKFSSTTRSSFNSLIISMFLGLVLLTRYQNYFMIISSVLGVLAIIHSSVTASVGDSIIEKDPEANYKDFNKFVFLYMWLSAFCTVCITCLIQPFMTLWLGKESLLPFGIVAVMSLYFYAQTMGDMVYLYRTAAGLWWEDRVRPIVEAAANIILNILLVKIFGLYGAVLATVLTLIFINFYWGGKILFKFYFKRSMREYILKQIFSALVTLTVTSITYGICSFINFSPILTLIARLPICVIVPNLIIWLCYRKTDAFNEAKKFTVNAVKMLIKNC